MATSTTERTPTPRILLMGFVIPLEAIPEEARENLLRQRGDVTDAGEPVEVDGEELTVWIEVGAAAGGPREVVKREGRVEGTFRAVSELAWGDALGLRRPAEVPLELFPGS